MDGTRIRVLRLEKDGRSDRNELEPKQMEETSAASGKFSTAVFLRTTEEERAMEMLYGKILQQHPTTSKLFIASRVDRTNESFPRAQNTPHRLYTCSYLFTRLRLSFGRYTGESAARFVLKTRLLVRAKCLTIASHRAEALQHI